MQTLRSLDDAGDAAISELYRQHAPTLLMHLRINMQSAEDAEDLLLDVFVAALERDSLYGLSAAEQRLWLWRVARNKLVDYYRKQKRRQHLPLEEVSETLDQDCELMPEWTALHNEEHRNLRAAIECLPSLQKEVVLLRFVNGLSVLEIAHILGKRDTAVRMILSRSLNLLREVFEKQLGEK